MGMFDNYENLNPEYVPNNTSTITNTRYLSYEDMLPHKMFDIKHRFIGHHWHQTEHFIYKVSVDNHIKVSEDSIIYDEAGQAPTVLTKGNRVGQHAYNTKDGKSWTFCGQTESMYMWVEDDSVIYPINGTKSIIIDSDVQNKYIRFTIFNFRWENILERTGNLGESELTINIDESISNILSPGVYYATVEICNDKECKLNKKYMIDIS